jgi:hypothetical protein
MSSKLLGRFKSSCLLRHLLIHTVRRYGTVRIQSQTGWFFSCMYFIQHCLICRPSDSTVSEDAGIEFRTVATMALAVRCSNHSARSHPHSARSPGWDPLILGHWVLLCRRSSFSQEYSWMCNGGKSPCWGGPRRNRSNPIPCRVFLPEILILHSQSRMAALLGITRRRSNGAACHELFGVTTDKTSGGEL